LKDEGVAIEIRAWLGNSLCSSGLCTITPKEGPSDRNAWGLVVTNPLDHRLAVYTGTFDPIHHGHLDIIERGSRIFDRLLVGVGINPDKQPFFDQDERVELVRAVIKPFVNVSVLPFTNLAVTFVRELGARIMLRGLRTTSDMENEFTMSLMNLNLDDEIETVFLMAKEAYSHLSSTLLRQIATFGGKLENFLPVEVKDALVARVRERQSGREDQG
jgi:pantetheine-phosphate adenylyltransferase